MDLFSLWVSIFIDYLLCKGSLGCNVVVFNYAMFNEQRLNLFMGMLKLVGKGYP